MKTLIAASIALGFVLLTVGTISAHLPITAVRREIDHETN